jgi:hypothetical protein
MHSSQVKLDEVENTSFSQLFLLLFNEILTYGYVKPRVQWFPNEEDPRPTPPGSPRAQGPYPSGTLTRTLRRRNLAEPDYATTSISSSGAHPSLESPDLRQHFDPVLGSCTASNASQGSGARRRAPSYRGLGAPRRCPLGTILPATFPTRSCTTRNTIR